MQREHSSKAKLSVVATPIGNLEDITLRALRVFKEANVVACEDTRVTKKLLSHFDIHTPTTTLTRIPFLLQQGKWVVLVSDAGVPGISDPGLEIVSNARSTGAVIETVPGASALAAAIAIAGLRSHTFTFYGFSPVKKGRETFFKTIATYERASVFYESPHRIMKTLETLARILPPTRKIGVFRELTKLYEESKIGSAQEIFDYYTKNPDKQRGEFVVIVEEA